VSDLVQVKMRKIWKFVRHHDRIDNGRSANALLIADLRSPGESDITTTRDHRTRSIERLDAVGLTEGSSDAAMLKDSDSRAM
jgi:hypothetical protein